MSSSRQSLDVAVVAGRRGPHSLTAGACALLLAACSDPQFEKPDSPEAGPSQLADGAKGDAEAAADARAPRNDAGPLSADARTSSSPIEDAASAPGTSEAGAPPNADRDAANVTAPTDAGVTPAKDKPTWAAQLVGEFALESIAFDGSDPLSGTAVVREVVWATISEDHELTTRQCESTWVNARMSGSVKYPERLPARRHRIQFSDDSFSTQPLDFALGYRSDPIPECANKAGEVITAPMARPWTTATTCRCPGPLLPPVDDCRVTDPDHDGASGYTVQGQLTGLGVSDVYGVTDVRSIYLNGKPRANGNGFVAQIELRDSSLQHDCKPSCITLSGSSASCDPATSRVTLAPLAKLQAPAGGWSCSAVLARAGELFEAPPAAPTVCSR